MTGPTASVIKYLREARLAQVAITEMYTAHIATTPAGDYRTILDEHVRNARRRGREIDTRLRELSGDRRPAWLVVDTARLLTGEALAAARFPLDLLAGLVALVRRAGDEERQLDNAPHEFAASAYALVTFRALERIAQAVGDTETAKLATAMREEHEPLFDRLSEAIDGLIDALIEAEVHGKPSYRLDRTGAAQVAQEGARRLREAVERGRDEIRDIPAVAQVENEFRGARAEASELPIPDYDELTDAQIIERLPHLSQTDLARIDGYERRNADRTTVLDKIKTLRGPEPWDGYDEMSVEEIRTRLRQGDPEQARKALDYERRHQNRPAVLEAAEKVRR